VRISKYIFSFTAICGILLVGWRVYGHPYYRQDIALGAVAPSWEHWFGTDRLGRDLFSRVLYGCYISLSVGIFVALMAVSFGTFYGIISGYFGGIIDLILMRVVDILYPIPLTLIVILLMVIFGRHVAVLFFAISVVEWMTTARIIRGEVLRIRESGYVQVARGLGERDAGIIRKHVLPNIMGVATVCFIITLPAVITLESFLSFLGLGVQPPGSSLGVLIAEGAKFMATSPWQIFFPSAVFIMVIWALTVCGDRLKH
jgi:oligopeptide transport system permease protein